MAGRRFPDLSLQDRQIVADGRYPLHCEVCGVSVSGADLTEAFFALSVHRCPEATIKSHDAAGNNEEPHPFATPPTVEQRMKEGFRMLHGLDPFDGDSVSDPDEKG